MKDTNKYIFTASSIFNDDLQVTEELHAVTYGKRAYNSLEVGDHPLVAEHAFIIIQTPNMFYRAEIGARKFPLIETVIDGEKVLTRPTPSYDYIINDEQHAFFNIRTFNQEKINVLEEVDVKDIKNLTWLVPKAKSQALMADIEADMGSIIFEEKNSIPYYGLGNESLWYEDKGQNFFNELLRLTSMIGGVAVGIIQLKNFTDDCKRHQELRASATHLCENSGCVFDGLRKSVGLMTAALSPLWTRAIIDSKCEPKKEYPKVHSCATWAAEKLHNLRIDDIDNDLQPSILLALLDKIGYLTSLHVGDMEELREAGVRNYPVIQEEIHKVMDHVESSKERKNNLLTAEEHKVTRCVILAGSGLIGSIATSKVADTVAENCFDR